MQPLKVYLDHKDYVNITRGLLGDKERRDDVETFELLHSFVEQGKATVYFSWVHIFEALKYDGTDSDILGQYCEAIEALTRGNCLLGLLDLRKREIEVFLSEEFGTPTKFNREKLAYGKYSEALFLESFDLDEDPIEMFKKGILGQARNRKERKLYEKQLANPNECKKLLRQQFEQVRAVDGF